MLKDPTLAHPERTFSPKHSTRWAFLAAALSISPAAYACQLVCTVTNYTLTGAADTQAAREAACTAAHTGFKPAKPGFLAALPGDKTIFVGAKNGDPCYDVGAAASAGAAAGKAALHSIAVGFGGWVGGSLVAGEAAYVSAYIDEYADIYANTHGSSGAANAAANSAGIAACAAITGIAAGTPHDFTNASNTATIAAAAFAAVDPAGQTGGTCSYSNNKLTCCNM